MVDLNSIRDNHHLQIDHNLQQANSKRISYNYKPNQLILKKKNAITKLSERWDRQFKIQHVHVNGMVTIILQGNVTKQINIRQIKLYLQPTQEAPVGNVTEAEI